jgi:carboxylate-amine ligase
MRTVGVEEELLLVNAENGRPRSVAAQVLRLAAERGEGGDQQRIGGSIVHEIQQHQLETDTRPHTDMAALEEDLRSWRSAAAGSARRSGARVLAVGTSPLPAKPALVETTRYRRIAERFGLTTSEQLTCGCHVHVSVEHDDEAVGVLDRIRVWLPSLLALSANSPFWQGGDSGYASYRSQVLYRWPTAGPPDHYGSAQNYHAHVQALLDLELDKGMFYADARLSHHYPTLEVRVADVCANVRDAVLVAALARGLVEAASRRWADGEPAPQIITPVLRLATWQAGRHGVRGRLLDPDTGLLAPAADVLHQMVDYAAEALRQYDDLALVEARLGEILRRGNGADRQHAVLERTGQLIDVVTDLARLTVGQEEG